MYLRGFERGFFGKKLHYAEYKKKEFFIYTLCGSHKCLYRKGFALLPFLLCQQCFQFGRGFAVNSDLSNLNSDRSDLKSPETKYTKS